MSSPLSEEEIDQLLSQRCISAAHPWGTDDERKIDSFYRSVCEEISRSTRTLSKIEWNHYGSGYASFIDAWFYRPKPEFALKALAGDKEAYAGVVVLLSRLSPFFVLMEGEKRWNDRSASSYMPSLELVDEFTRPAVKLLAEQLRESLEQQGLRRLQRRDLSSPLRADATVPTILSEAPYTVFDALFHWED